MAFWEAAFNGTYGNNYRLRQQVDVIGTEIQNNRTRIRYNAWWEKTGAGSTYNGYTTYATTNINGHAPQRAMGGFNMVNAGQRIYFAQNEDYWVNHDGNGQANPYFAVAYNTGTVGSATTGGNMGLAGFWLYLGYEIVTIDEITANSMRVRLRANGTFDRYAYSLNGGGSWTEVGANTNDVTFTIGGLAAYTTYNLRFSVRKNDSQRWSEHGNHPRTTLGFANFTSFNVANVTDSSASMSLAVDAPVSQITPQYRVVGTSDWINYPFTFTGTPTSAALVLANLVADTSYEMRAIVKRSDSGLDTTSTTATIRTEASNKFFIAAGM